MAAQKRISYKQDQKTMHNVFDEFTNRNIYKLMTEGYFKGVIGQITLGKESNVFQARKEDGSKVIVKIYRLESCDFNRMYDYIKYDPRFLKLKKVRREIIFAWTQREYRNLLKAREAGVSVPTPLTFKDNILLEEFIGDDEPAPKLKDLRPEDPQAFFEKVIINLKKLYKAKLVHADLSAFNILNDNEKPVFIDFSQCTPFDNPNAKEYLLRDIKNVCIHFKKLGVQAELDAVIDTLKK
ncbi:serine protein kinase RIO [Candidatus Woesearchaeota archaeon]|nr:serine protein kinase RIO [Candidatus Woesearchaeota archaeon]